MYKPTNKLINFLGYVNTPYKLNIISMKEHSKAQKEEWGNLLQVELADLKEQYEEEYEEKLSTYKKAMKIWLRNRNKRSSK